MEKFVLKVIRYAKDRFNLFHFFVFGSVAFTLHVVGIRHGLGSVGFVFNNPINALIILSDLALAFTIAYMWSWALVALFGACDIFLVETVSRWRGKGSRLAFDPFSEFYWSYIVWLGRISGTIAIYSYQSVLLILLWLTIGMSLLNLLSYYEKLSPRNRDLDKDWDRFTRLELDKSVGYNDRILFYLAMLTICLVVYSIGILRVVHLKGADEIEIVTPQETFSASMLYYLSDVMVVHDEDRDQTIVITLSPEVQVRSIGER